MSSTNANTEEKLKKMWSWWEDIKCSHTKKGPDIKTGIFPLRKARIDLWAVLYSK